MNAPNDPSSHGFTDRPTLDVNAIVNLVQGAIPSATEHSINPQAGWQHVAPNFGPDAQPPSGRS
jgi:hypothetical protein